MQEVNLSGKATETKQILVSHPNELNTVFDVQFKVNHVTCNIFSETQKIGAILKVS